MASSRRVDAAGAHSSAVASAGRLAFILRELHELIFARLVLADAVAALRVSKIWRTAARARLAVLAPGVRPLLVAPFRLSPGDVLHATHLDVSCGGLGDAGAAALAKACASGALAQLTVLGLEDNQIGDVGLEALAKACAGGALAQCRELYLLDNQIGDEGIKGSRMSGMITSR